MIRLRHYLMKIIIIYLLPISLDCQSQNLDSLRIIELINNNENLDINLLTNKYSYFVTPVDSAEFELLYYSKFSRNDFSYFDLSIKEKQFGRYYQARQYDLAKNIGVKILKNDPTDLKTLLHTSICYDRLSQSDTSKLLMDRLYCILRIIERYGDGSSEANSYKLVKISDEYAINELSSDMEYYRKSRVSKYGILDTWETYSYDTKKRYKRYFFFNNLYTDN